MKLFNLLSYVTCNCDFGQGISKFGVSGDNQQSDAALIDRPSHTIDSPPIRDDRIDDMADYYETNAQSFVGATQSVDMSDCALGSWLRYRRHLKARAAFSTRAPVPDGYPRIPFGRL